MALDPEDVGLIQQIVSNMLVKLLPGVLARECVTADSSLWNPQENVAGHGFGHTFAPIDDDDGQTIIRQGIPHAVGAFGVQYGPRGNERSVLLKTDCGYVALYRHGNDGTIQDSPGAPSGELWMCHYDENFIQNAWVKLTNDSTTGGDGLASLTALAGALLSLSTVGGLQIVARDDVGLVGVGNDPTILTTNDDVVRRSDLQSIINAILDSVQVWGGDNFAAGTSSPPAPASVTALASLTVRAQE